ncbi:MAG: phenylalanine--tRNA ligase subunit beta, partial [Pseudomonadota bacterium]
SHGMLCSAKELGLSEESEGLMSLSASAPAGSSLIEYLKLDDTVIEIDLTPNRGDCLGIEGVAREIGTLTRTAVTSVDADTVTGTIDDCFDIQVEAPEACPRYLGRVIRGVDTTAETPLWMQERLRRGGIRSLGPAVDVTNYVLLELGQPMHAFDLAKLAQGIRVRFARDGEKLVLLDDRTIELNTDTLIIADHEKPLAIAGVMGGIDSGVQASTTDLFLECAFFTPEAIAGRARQFGMHTDSAFRFERGVDPGLQRRAVERATRLMLEIMGGQAGPVIEVIADEHLPTGQTVELRRARIQRVLGMLPADDEIVDILTRLGMQVEATAAGWDVNSPTFRFDIEIEADLIEEVGRIYGYNRLESSALNGALEMQAVPETQVSLNQLSDLLVARGYQEAVTYSFVDPKLQAQINPEKTAVRLANPISAEMAEMRTSLWPGLIKAAQHNLNRQKSRPRLFESGLRFYKDGEAIKQDVMVAGIVTGTRLPEGWDGGNAAVDFYDVKRDLDALLGVASGNGGIDYVAARHPALHPGQTVRLVSADSELGYAGRIHPLTAERCDIPPDTFLFELVFEAINKSHLPVFEEISRFPSIRRDLAIVVDEAVQARTVENEVREAAGELLREVVIFDVYQGPGVESGRKSIAFGLILQDSSRTLVDEDIEAVMGNVTKRLGEKIGATLRD